MGMYAPFIVKAVDGAGNFVNVINDGGPSYDYEMILMYSSVDRSYHTATGDSTVFADYNPQYFLVNGNEGRTKTAPAVSLTAAPSKNVVIRLMGVQSVNTTFEIRDSSGNVKSFTQHNFDGYKLPSPKTLTSLDLSPGQTADVMVTLPSTTGTYYPQVTFKNLRNGGTYSNGTVYAKLAF
jgi:FtsP/CotA-like multicopper oxidase with cupredoxin domain